jgi:signal transduction histidine kinase
MEQHNVLYSYEAGASQKILYLSPNIGALSGYDVHMFQSSTAEHKIRDLIHPEDQTRIEKSIAQALSAHIPFDISYRILTADRQEKRVREWGSGVYDPQGKLQCIEGRIEASPNSDGSHQGIRNLLHQTYSRELYAAIARYFPNTIITVVDEQQRLIFVDGEEAAQIGLDKQQAEGKLLDDIRNLPWHWKKYMTDHMRNGRDTRRFSYEVDYRDQFYMVNGMPLKDSIQRLYLFFYTNISEQKRTEVEMINALKKERELGELKSRFVSMASHEFRTPLSTILSSANLIARQNEPGRESQRLKNVERIRSSVRNLVDILNEFLSLGRLEQGQVSVNKEDFELIAFMHNIVQELQHARKPGQKVHISASEKNIEVRQDKQFIRNIFLNLVSNSLKYSPEGRPVEIVISTLGDRFNVKVIDQGVGIPEDEHKHLFDLFFRARNATNIEGTGLGLPIVKKFIDLMQGEIAVESKVDQGTTFSITLPIDQVQIEQA